MFKRSCFNDIVDVFMSGREGGGGSKLRKPAGP